MRPSFKRPDDAYPEGEQDLNTPPASPSGRTRSLQAHNAIMDATLAMVREVGYHRLTIEGVATHAKVGKATIYRWWPTKAHLVIGALAYRRPERSPLTGDSAKDIRAMILRKVGAFAGPIGYILPAVAADLADDPDASHLLAGLRGTHRAGEVAVLLSAIVQGDLPHDLDTATVLDTISGTVLYRRLMHLPLDDALADQLTTLVLTGQLPRIKAPHTEMPATPSSGTVALTEDVIGAG